MESCNEQKSVQQTRIWFIFYILQRSHLLLWWQLCTLFVFSEIHEVVTWNGFPPCQEFIFIYFLFVPFLMCLRTSAVLCSARVGTQFQIVNSAQLIVRHYFKTWRLVDRENVGVENIVGRLRNRKLPAPQIRAHWNSESESVIISLLSHNSQFATAAKGQNITKNNNNSKK